MGKRKETSTNFENKAILSGECNQIYAEVPPRVEYELTAIGKELIPILEQLGERGDRHKNALLVDFKE